MRGNSLHSTQQPSRAGLAVFAAALLTSALLATPLVATQLAFGHSHQEDTTAHVHDIDAVLTPSAPVAALSVATKPSAPAPVAVDSVDPAVAEEFAGANGIRAPPLLPILL